MSGSFDPAMVEVVAAVIFAVAVAHTFSTAAFHRLAQSDSQHAGVWRLLGEVEVVFPFWGAVLLCVLAASGGARAVVEYLDSLNFTEPAFIFVIMVITASRPVLSVAEALMGTAARLLPIPEPLAYYFVALFMGPLLGSFITEPAAMTLSALLIAQRFFGGESSTAFKYATMGVLFVNVSIGGTLTPFAAPPVLMVAGRWGWDLAFMFDNFAPRTLVTTLVNAAAVTVLFRHTLSRMTACSDADECGNVTPWALSAVQIAILAAIVAFGHHMIVFGALFLVFLGVAEAYSQHQSRLMIREGLMVAIFLAGLVVLGGQQKWWLQPLISGLPPDLLYLSATALTAITDNAALTYLGSLVDGLPPEAKYALVAGAVSGGGLTVIANAPNPAGFAILHKRFGTPFNPFLLFAAALGPTILTVLMFWVIPL